MVPKKGDIAICRAGLLGLITGSAMKIVTYKDGESALAYTGIHLTDKREPIGSLWSSRDPQIIGHVKDGAFVFDHDACNRAGVSLIEIF